MAMEGLKKHVGQLSNTGVRVAVVFRKLPNDVEHCLIVETERLPDMYHDNIMQCLNSKESFETNDFYEVLNRRTFPDGLNCLAALHQKGFLRKEPVNNVVMIPLPGKSVPLALINATIDKTPYNETPVPKPERPEDNRTPAEKLAAAEALAAAMQDPGAQAKQLIASAEALEAEATAKREQAYEMAPELKPGRGRPALDEDEKAVKLEERKAKRLERDRRNAAAAKVEKAEKAIDDKVAKKLQRDAARAEQAK